MMRFVSLGFLAAFAASKQVDVYDSCVGLEDGEYYIQLDNVDSTVQAQCSNGYAIIDYSKDNNWRDYFSSWYLYHYGISGPLKGDTVNWQQWFLPDSGETAFNYLISKDCSVCDESASENELHGLQSTYYMNGSSFGCFSFGRGRPGCDMSYDTYECQGCLDIGGKLLTFSVDNIPEDILNDETYLNKVRYGNCLLEKIESNFKVDTTYSECTATISSGTHKPSLGIDGRNCICVQKASSTSSSDNENEKENENDKDDDVETKTVAKIIKTERVSRETKKNTEEKDMASNVVYLYQNDFNDGTYRIKESGIYIIMEDIIFDFNAPNDIDLTDSNNIREYSPNSNNYWWPKESQNDEYPSRFENNENDFSQPYFVGFFAGITVECDDVTIDLNGKTLAMSKEFFYSQPYWSHIELANQAFMPGQGIGFFGGSPVFASNVIIKDGIFDLTSHHCIHGLGNKNIEIDNIVCKNFVTHGIQLNGFENVKISNVEIGPSNEINYLSIEYFTMRSALPRFRYMAEHYPEASVKFVGRDEETMVDLLDRLITRMDMAFKYVVYGIEYNEFDKEYNDFIEAKKTFIKWENMATNTMDGIPNGGVMYGLLLNYHSSAIPGYYLTASHSTTAALSNINIHDLTHNTKETVMFSLSKSRAYVGPLNTPLSFISVVGEESFNSYMYEASVDNMWELSYKGTIVTDITIALQVIADEVSSDGSLWSLLGLSYIDEMATLVTTGMVSAKAEVSAICAGDGFIHNAKGTMGLRINGVSNVEINGDIDISNLYETSKLGSDKCGTYKSDHFSQQLPYQVGYTGNRVQGMVLSYSDVTINNNANLNINNLESSTGASYGVGLWLGAQLTIDDSESKINVKNVISGIDVEMGSLTTDETSLPNLAPESCGIRVYNDEYYGNEAFHDDDDSAMVTLLNENVESSLSIECVSGHVGCLLDDSNGFETNFDGYNTIISSNEECSDTYYATFEAFSLSSVKHYHHHHNNNNSIRFNALIFVIVVCVVSFYFLVRKFINGSNDNKILTNSVANEVTPLIN